jgi:replicative DNA helicase
VLALSQLSRKVEERLDKRPQLSDLRESGAIEQDADAVLFCYREEYYLERESTERRNEREEQYQERMQDLAMRKAEASGKCEVIVAKNRHGKIGTAKLRFVGETTGFEEYE